MSQEDINAALDALEIENETITEPEDEVVESVEDPEKEVEDKPPGFKTYDQWIEEGRDPDLYKGKKAYEKEYDRIQEIKELKGLVTQVVDTTSEWKQQQQEQMQRQIEQAREDAQAALDKAKEDDDIDAALAAKDKLANLNRPPSQPQQNPIITQYVKDNPILDPASSQYDKDFHQDLQMTQHAIINQLTGGDPNLLAQLTSEQLQRSLNVAMVKTKELHADKFVSPRNNRRRQPAPGKRTEPGSENYDTKIKQMKVKGKNPRDEGAANDIYQMLKDKDPAAAEKFAKNMLGE